jgi:hypothetical protein
VDEKDINRMMMHFEQMLRKANREHINPVIEELTPDNLRPIVNLVARARAVYLKHMYELCKKYDGTDALPSTEELCELSELRSRFVDLSDGAKSFEISIQRGYLDLKL